MKKQIKRALLYLFNGQHHINITAQISTINPHDKLKGKGIIITGGSRGLGFYIAQKCISEGASVLITGRNETVLKEASLKLDNCKFLSFDVQNIDKIPSFIKKAGELLEGRLDCLVSNAGISLHEGNFRNVTPGSFDKQFNTNLRGAYFLAQEFAKHLEKSNNDNGNILFITSERGLYCDDIPYGLTKAAINSLTKGLSRRLLPLGIRVNAVAPGVTASDMTGYKKEDNLFRPSACGKRVFMPEEVAEVAAFLLSDATKCISGEIIACNQGNHLRCDW